MGHLMTALLVVGFLTLARLFAQAVDWGLRRWEASKVPGRLRRRLEAVWVGYLRPMSLRGLV